MLTLLLIIIAILMIIIEVVILYKLLSKKNSKIQETDTKTKPKRKHTYIARASFDNVLKGRNCYDKYKNKDGLYEPVIGKRGIELKKRGE